MLKNLSLSLILLLSLVGCAGTHFTPLTESDYELQGVVTVLTCVDWRQTQMLTKQHSGYEELNPLLGSHPSRQKVDRYMAAGIAGQWFVTWALPVKYRKNWQWFLIGSEAAVVLRNHSIGVRFTFD